MLAATGLLMLLAAQVKAGNALQPGWYVSADTGMSAAVFRFTPEQFEYYSGTKTCNFATKGGWTGTHDSVALVTSWLREYCPDPPIPFCMTGVPHLPDTQYAWIRTDTIFYGRNIDDPYVERFVRICAYEAKFPVTERTKELARVFGNPGQQDAVPRTHPSGTYECSTMHDRTLLELSSDGTFRMKEKFRFGKDKTSAGSWRLDADTLLLFTKSGAEIQRLYFYR